MNWNQLNSVEQWNTILESKEKFIVFKHSTRCSISTTALSRFERDWDTSSSVKPYYLDLLEHRNISNAIAQNTGVEHESPQAILIENGKVLKFSSHLSIYVAELLEA
jgi:bacillithiol system protein YtxJ